MKKYRSWIIAIFLVTVMPFINHWFGSLILNGPEISVESWVDIWVRGFVVLIFELIVIALPGLIPVVGDFYLAWLGRLLGFPDEEVEKAFRNGKK